MNTILSVTDLTRVARGSKRNANSFDVVYLSKLASEMLRAIAAITLIVGADALAAVPVPDVPAPPKLDVVSYILVDFSSGTVLAEQNANDRAELASLTKIMTAYVAADALASGAIALDDTTTVSDKAWRMGGSRMFIEVNKQVSVDDLLQGVIIQSGNDASVAIAEHISGSEEVFAAVMNQQAERLGMKNSSFANSSGLPDPNLYSTAHDLALLAAAFIRDFPEMYQRFSQAEFSYAGIRQHNRNRLLSRDESVDGVKTGHTEAAGFCLVSSALRGDMRLVAAVMGAKSDVERTEASQALLNYGFRFFESRKIYSVGDAVASAKVWKGKAREVQLGVGSDLHVALPRGRYDDVEAVAEISESVNAPIDKGQAVGILHLKLDGEDVATAPLVANEAVAKGSIFSRALDEVRMRIE